MRLSRLYAPAEVQLAQVKFAPALSRTWQAQPPPALFDRLAQWLAEQAKNRGLQMHAWSLTPMALRLLATPPDAQAMSAVVQALGRRLAATLRAGGVFAGRYKSALVAPEMVLKAQIWVESAPGRDGCASHPVDWAWSSAATHTGAAAPARPWVMPLVDHQAYWGCGNTPFDRQATYQSKLVTGLSAIERDQVEAAVTGQWALGPESYLNKLDKSASRRSSPGRRGRPSKQVATGL